MTKNKKMLKNKNKNIGKEKQTNEKKSFYLNKTKVTNNGRTNLTMDFKQMNHFQDFQSQLSYIGRQYQQ